MLSEQDITAIRTRVQREWKASHQLQAKRKGRAAASLNLADVMMLLAEYEKARADFVRVDRLYTTTSREREAAVAGAAQSQAAMREARTERDKALDRVETLTQVLFCWVLWPWRVLPLRLLWPRFRAVVQSLKLECRP